ncbi:MAG: hypothetical protein ACREKL_15700, partial [Chthoniobacterales bacterium]
VRVKLWLRVAAVLALVWLIAAGTAWTVRSMKPTPESLVRYVDAHPIAAASPAERPRIIDKVAAQLNRLDYEQRRSVRMSKSLDGFFHDMTEPERNAFLDKTLPEGFHQMMIALNKMTPEKRKQIVDRALADIEKSNTDGSQKPRRPVDDAQAKKIVNQGMSAFYEDASADVKLDFAPVIEQIQRSMQNRQ